MSLDLVVLLISENDLRSALTARLTMLGINVVTLRHDRMDDGLSGTAIARAVLVTDDEALGRTASDTPLGWLQVIVLNGSSGGPADRPLRLSRRGATRRVVDALTQLHDPIRPE